MGGWDAQRREFVDARWPELRRLALLIASPLDGESARAPTEEQDLAVTVLGRALDNWRRLREAGRPAASVRDSFVHHLVRLHRDSGAADPSSPSSSAGPESRPPAAPRATDPSTREPSALEQAWRDLRPAERAAYVLVVVDHGAPEEAADALGMPPADLRATLTDTERRLAAAHARDRAHDGLAPLPSALEPDVAALLADRVWAGPEWRDPFLLLAARTSGIRRRRRVSLAAALSALALAPAAWVVGRNPPAVEQRVGPAFRVLWSDDVDTRRYVFVVARAGGVVGPESGYLFSGPRGCAGADLTGQPVFVEPVPGSALALTTAPEGSDTRHLVVIAAPGVRAETGLEWSRTVTIGADASITRTWEPLDLIDGVAVRALPTSSPALSLRTTDDAVIAQATPQVPFAVRADVPCEQCPGPAEIRGRLGAARAGVVAATGLAPEQITVELLWSGRLDSRVVSVFQSAAPTPAPAGGPDPAPGTGRPAYLARLHLPSGAVLQTAEVLLPHRPDLADDGSLSGSGPSVDPVDPVDPAGPGAPNGPVWQQLSVEEPVTAATQNAPFVVPWFVSSSTGQGVLVIVPPTSGIVEVTSELREGPASQAPSTPRPAPVPVTGATAYLVVPFGSGGADQTFVIGHDAAGRVVAEAPLVETSPLWWGPYDSARPQLEAMRGRFP